jgi:tetratricopeptide (TPR) repeat protein
MGKYDSAIYFYKKAVNIAPLFEEPLKNIAISYFNLKQFDSCISRIENLKVPKDSLMIKLLNDSKILKEMSLQPTK